MFKKIILSSLAILILGLLFGEKATEVITTIISTVLLGNPRYSTAAPKERLFSHEELKLYNGVDKPELYLSVLGNVFDVTRGSKHYGPNQQYNVFVGRDASRSFVTGEFDGKDSSEEVADLSPQDLKTINSWLKFYKKEYTSVGKLIGRYFNEHGKSTAYRKVVRDLIKKAEQAQNDEDLEKIKFPPCNVEWNAETGTRVWCTDSSGGITRDWIGVPRQLYEAGTKSYRCACINAENEKLGNIKEYDGCDVKSQSCFVTL